MTKIVDKVEGARFKRSEAQASNSLKLASQDVKEEKQWAAALNSRNCNRLMELLDEHPSLWLITGPENCTVLHVAVMQGCVELVKLILFGPPKANGNRQVLQGKAKVLLYAKDVRCKADVFELSAIVGNKEVKEILISARQRRILKGSPSASSHTTMKSTNFDYSNEFTDLLKELPRYESLDYDYVKAFTDLLSSKKFIYSLKKLPSYSSLQMKMKQDVDYNFEGQQKGLVFNFACKKAHSNIGFLRNVVTRAEEKEIPLKKLFTQMDAQGRAPLHVAVDHCKGVELTGIKELLELMPDECVNVRDGAGRTPLLRATANGLNGEASEVVKVLAGDKRTDLNAEWPGGSGATALHLAVLHGHEASARFVLEADRDPTERANVEKQMSRRIKVFKQAYLKWTPLELAAIMGRHSVLVTILEVCRKRGIEICDKRCLHLAAAAGDPRSVQALLLNRLNDLQHFETNHNFGGYSCLHFAVFASLPHQHTPIGVLKSVKAIDEEFDRFLAFSDFGSVNQLQQELTTAAGKGSQKLGMPISEIGVKKTCTILLLRAGVDIWPSGSFLKEAFGFIAKHSSKHEEDLAQEGLDFHHSTPITHIPSMPDPGSDASDDDRLWWFELAASETLKTKNNFNAAGNATAVVATLVATASFIGPLTPPLGYGSDDSSPWTLDHVQMASLSIRAFMASNSLSFYLAIASIMLAIMPSLPMPQEDLREELHRNQRTVALAITMLLLSMLGLLASFTSCLIAVSPRHRYWNFTFYPAFVGGIICSIVIFLFFFRVLRLVFNKNAGIKKFYRCFGLL